MHTPSWIFEIGARTYSWLTDQDVWRSHCGRVARSLGREGSARPGRILDLGVGPGVSAFATLDVWSESRCVGVDLSRRMLAEAMRRGARRSRRIELVRSDARRLPFADRSFDGLIAHSFFYLVSERAAVLGEAARMLAPGAPFAMLEPREQGRLLPVARAHWSSPRFVASMALWRLASRGCGGWYGPDLESCLAQAGFVDVRLEPTLGGLGWVATGARGAAARSRRT
jgi:ubiquinone/menaquinone biosynthesis C-methylase UbiE